MRDFAFNQSYTFFFKASTSRCKRLNLAKAFLTSCAFLFRSFQIRAHLDGKKSARLQSTKFLRAHSAQRPDILPTLHLSADPKFSQLKQILMTEKPDWKMEDTRVSRKEVDLKIGLFRIRGMINSRDENSGRGTSCYNPGLRRVLYYALACAIVVTIN